MHTTETQRTFIELRVQGLSIRKIAEQLKISTKTATNWTAKYAKQIDKLKFLEFEALEERLLYRQQEELAELVDELKRAKAELKNRSFEFLTTPFLLRYKAALMARIDKKRVKAMEWEEEGENDEGLMTKSESMLNAEGAGAQKETK